MLPPDGWRLEVGLYSPASNKTRPRLKLTAANRVIKKDACETADGWHRRSILFLLFLTNPAAAQTPKLCEVLASPEIQWVTICWGSA
jgi:hypothetical protein